jgi:DNA-binding PadR family transcriptional regulator
MAAAQPRLTMTTLRILKVLIEDPTRKRYGLEMCELAGLPSGTTYPILARLEQAGWLVSEWETINPEEARRPRRRYYLLTGTGRERARLALKDATKLIQPQWAPAPEGVTLAEGVEIDGAST